MNFPQRKIWSVALQAQKPDLSAKPEPIHTSEVDLQLEEQKTLPKSGIKMQIY